LGFDEVVGGASGQVWIGEWLEAPVALKEILTGDTKNLLIAEAKTLRALNSPRIVRFFGIYQAPDTEKQYIVTEYVSGGSLKDYLKNLKNQNQEIDPSHAWRIIYQTAVGMKFLEEKKIYHRDLAARNLLVYTDTNGLNIKIADFGLASPTFSIDGLALPVRWIAPEVFRDKRHSSTSDVYSYGCVIYEIASGGEDPWCELQLDQVIEAVKEGKRMTIPPNCPKLFYDIMTLCWLEFENRPTFVDLCQFLSWQNQILKAQGSVLTSEALFSPVSPSRKASVGSLNSSSSDPETLSKSSPGSYEAYPVESPASLSQTRDPSYVFLEPKKS